MKDPEIYVNINPDYAPKTIRVSVNHILYTWACPEIPKDKEEWYSQVMAKHFLHLYKQAQQETVQCIKSGLEPLKELLED